jgi:dTDP-glucose pyrophosphorylase
MSSVNIVVPMAGKGSRFKDAGYDVPKPFISFLGKMMIEHVLDGLVCPDAHYTLIIQESFRRDYPELMKVVQQNYPVDLFAVDGPMCGAASTALALHKHINNPTPVVFADCDNIFRPGTLESLLKDAESRNLDGTLLTFPSTEPVFSFAALNAKGMVERMAEKEPISSHAICGVYHFAKGEDFVASTIHNMVYSLQQRGEYYMSGAYTPLIQWGKRIGIHEIAANAWDCVGTPDQLNAYLASKSK